MALTVNNILDQLKDDMEDTIDPTDDYYTKPTVRHGVFTKRDLEGSLPVVAFACYAEDLIESQSDAVASEVFVRIYGYAQSDGAGGKGNAKELAHDVLHFLFSSDWTYEDQTWIISNIAYLEPGDKKPVGSFVFDIKIRHDGTYDTLRN